MSGNDVKMSPHAAYILKADPRQTAVKKYMNDPTIQGPPYWNSGTSKDGNIALTYPDHTVITKSQTGMLIVAPSEHSKVTEYHANSDSFKVIN